MNKIIITLGMLLTLLLSGCGSEEKIVLQSPPGNSDNTTETTEQKATWETLVPEHGSDPRTQPQYIEKAQAPKAPPLKVSTRGGRERTIRPGDKDAVTLVVFWSIDTHITKAALMHVDSLVKKYRKKGLRGIAITEKTTEYRKTPEFLEKHNIELPVYYDEFAALKKMGRAADLKVHRDIPCFFITGPELKIRFFKRGFAFSTATTPGTDGLKTAVIENAPPGDRIEDYAMKLLK